mmetsp:Transcript_3314/g.7750  ORF Transcript_3314/g.7750 Transcript_3314/m.7750 type:complete len:394 (+) Transcript_3314:56-1237(+)|eukprot:CAMPEP_0181411946 /NCGR_PEP_ID=MMETSP1110-20121109/8163_1 /TAXON_ID=174948 /ORGANISM="Symbiodinium sp., Strain CCMP421" /LENGTH=393 /DNA_ID=CAMNT_0023534633 /DNA_START=56 /DNA_END=1237 /DNA_ORIENTATION=-
MADFSVVSTLASTGSDIPPSWLRSISWDILTVLLVLFNFFLVRWLLRCLVGRKPQPEPEPEKRWLSAEETFCKKVLCYIAQGDIASSIAAFQDAGQEMAQFSQAPVLLMKLFKLCESEDAWELYGATRDLEYSRALYHTVISILARGQGLDHSAEVLKDMALQDVVPDASTYGCLIRAQLARGDLESSVQVLGQMQRREVRPDLSTFQAVLDVCAHRQLPTLAAQILSDMEAAQVQPSSATLATLIRLHGRCGDLDSAKRVFREMPSRHSLKVDSQVYAGLVCVCMAEGEISEAFQVYEQMTAAGYQPDAACYKALLTGSLQQGDLDAAQRLIDDALSNNTGLLAREAVELFLLQSLRRGRKELAKPVLEQVQQAGVFVSERIVSSVQRACGN